MLPIGTIIRLSDNMCPYNCKIIGYALTKNFDTNLTETKYVMEIMGPSVGYYVEGMKMTINTFICHPNVKFEVIETLSV